MLKCAQNFVQVKVQTLWATLLPLYTKECVGSLTSQLTGLMRRKRYYITDNLSISAKKHRAAEIMEVLTKLLSQGWNP